MHHETRDPDEGYVSRTETGWIPIPTGHKRVVATFNVPETMDSDDVVTMLEALLSDNGIEQCDPTTWESQPDYVNDWNEGLA